MKILVANLGSTSFKYRLFDMESETQLAKGGIERIGAPESNCVAEIAGNTMERTAVIPDHAEAVRQCLQQLTDPQTGCLSDPSEVQAIGFKAVHGGRFSGTQKITEEVLQEMERLAPVAPAHNPPYVAAMRQLSEKFPEIPLVASFETGFHQTIPDHQRYYGVPFEWAEAYGILRWGFHGASHRYIAGRIAELTGRSDLKAVSCHLGGSSSLCAIRNGQSVAASMGMSPQTGLMHNNRTGDFDPFAIPIVMQATGKSMEEVLDDLACRSGLLGVSGVSGDMRDLENAAAEGNERAKLAIDAFVASIRNYLGAFLFELGALDAIIFTGGIGEKGKLIRKQVCANLASLGIELDESLNENVQGESKINTTSSRTEIWVVPTNEEIIVARQTKSLLEG